MKYVLLPLFALLCVATYAQTYDLSFDQVNWSTGSGITFNGNELTIEGSNGPFRSTRYTLDVDPNMNTLYFTVRVKLDNISGGPAGWDRPKIRIESTGGAKLINYNLPTDVQGEWVHTGVKIDNFKNQGLSQVVLVLGIQNASGTMTVTEPLVSSDRLTGTYSFPYDIPTDPSVALDITLDEYHRFEDDLLSTNCHFTWAPYNWEDQNVKDAIYQKFPMKNLRFPGGTVANFYNWQTDDFYDNRFSDNNNTARNGAQDAKKFGYPGYVDVTKTLEGSSTLLFNVFSDDKATSQGRLQSRIADGLDIKWIEMGNENYFGEQAYAYVDDTELGLNGNGDGEDYDEYIQHTKNLASWLREVDPDIKVAVNTHDDHWNTPLAAEDYYDACVVHNYNFVNGFMLNQFSTIQFMQSYKKTQNVLQRHVNTFGDKPVIMSEWGLLSEMPPYFLQVLCMADNFLSIEKGGAEEIVAQAGIHMLYHGNFVGEASLIMHNGSEIRINPVGVAYSKLYDVFLGHNVYDAYSSSAELEANLDAVHAKAVDAGEEIYVFAVNKLPVASPLKLSINGESYGGAYEMESYSIDMDARLNESHTSGLYEDPWEKTSGTGMASLPANSITVVTIRKSDFQELCLSPDLGGDAANLCGIVEMELETRVSPTNRTFTWYKDGQVVASENGSSLSVSSPGEYRVVADSAGCIREGLIDVTEELPLIYLGNDVTLCESTSLTLDGAINNPEVEYTWEKDGVPLNHQAGALEVFTPGMYQVSASAGNCPEVMDAISITSNLTSVSFDTLCGPGTATLQINDNGDFTWYNAPENGTELSNELSYSAQINASTTFYVQDNTIDERTVGRSTIAGTSFGGTTDYTIWGRTMWLEVETGFFLEEVDIFTNSSVDVVLNINGSGGDYQYTENEIPNTGKSSPYTLRPNLFIPTGEYTMNLVGTSGQVYVQVSDLADNLLPGILEFGGTDGGSHYGFLYNWKLSIPNTCARTPVQAVINPEKEGCIITGIEGTQKRESVFPNPTRGPIHFDKAYEFRVTNAFGKVLSSGIGKELDLANVPAGIYFIVLENEVHQVLKY